MDNIYQSLYDEFGEERVHITRREETARTGKQPSYIQLFTTLCLKHLSAYNLSTAFSRDEELDPAMIVDEVLDGQPADEQSTNGY